ncbi:Na+/H+ antiporter subunit G [Lutibaculum baratangense]|uniref:Na(+) H(+) antiporter subunit G n=1 Tax=Lutibaculum baratangense AMV1 TaxID=631454 RepID=V4TMC0_9HYPH|nr:Na+/H+ antiporter subunit G [Lutibaculum baratangense]ESR26883.1 Na(+) H(+) antiporter subunit G [Lutibaculum baratangense AMV1]
MYLIADIVISIVLVIGGFFIFVGSFGLAKLPDTMRRLHGPTKATTLGVGSILIASMLYFLIGQGNLSFHELLVTIFLFLTAPVSANVIAKAYLRKNGDGKSDADAERRTPAEKAAPVR